MSRKPEGRFVAAVNAKLPPSVHHQGMALMFSNGTPDQYYDSTEPNSAAGRVARDLWIEYKWLPKTPQRKFVPKLSALQLLWLKRRHAAGQNAWVIVGFPPSTGATIGKVGIVLLDPAEWEYGVDPSKYLPMTPEGLATRIREYVHTS